MDGSWWTSPQCKSSIAERDGATYDEIMEASRRGPSRPQSRPVITLQRIVLKGDIPREYDHLELRLKALQEKINLVRSHIKKSSAAATEAPSLFCSDSADSVTDEGVIFYERTLTNRLRRGPSSAQAFSHIAIDSDIDDDDKDNDFTRPTKDVVHHTSDRSFFALQFGCGDTHELELEEYEYCSISHQ